MTPPCVCLTLAKFERESSYNVVTLPTRNLLAWVADEPRFAMPVKFDRVTLHAAKVGDKIVV